MSQRRTGDGWSWPLRQVGVLLAAIAAVSCTFAARADAFVYWANGGSGGTTIGRANNDGTGVDNNFITGAKNPCGVAIDSKHIYWGNGVGANSIGRANLDGSGVNQFFITGAVFPCGVALTGTQIWWTNGATSPTDTGRIAHANLNGTGVNQGMYQNPQVNDPCGLSVRNGIVYWTNNGTSPRTIFSAGLDGTPPPAPLVPDAGSFPVCWPSVTSTHLYWSVIPLGMLRGPVDDPGAGTEPVTMANPSGGTAIHGSKVYWANNQEGTVSRANLDGNSPELAFLTGAKQPRGLAVDSGQPPPSPPGSCSDFTLGKAKKNKKKGTAKLPVEVDCAGALELAGKGLKPSSADATAAGEVKLKVKAKGKAKKKLKKKGKKKFEADVTFTPTGGTANTEDTKVKLVKK